MKKIRLHNHRLIGSYLVIGSWLLLSLVSCGESVPDLVDQSKQSPPFCGDRLGISTEMLDEMNASVWRDDVGTSHLSITTERAEAQAWFDQGLNYLHGFWYIEAYRAFRQVVKIDPGCAMGYWGIAMCQPGFGGDDFSVWQAAIRQAIQRSQACTAVEKGLIDALQVMFSEGLPTAAGRWQRLADKFPEEPEVIAFAAIILRQSVQTEQESERIKTLLENAIARFPDHIGLLHYYVHLLEVRPDFQLATAAAERMVTLAPGNSHLTHMPGHLHFLAGAYAEAVDVFEAARKQELAYHQAESISAAIDQNYMHNLHYLSVAYSELGDYNKAIEIAKEYASLTLRRSVPKESADWMLLYQGRILPALVHIRFRAYGKAYRELGYWLSVPTFPIDNPLVVEYLSAMQAYCSGMIAISENDENAALAASHDLKAGLERFSALSSSTEISSEEMVHLNQTYDIMMMAWYELVGWGVNMDNTQAFIAEPWDKAFALENAIGYAEPPRLTYPVGESLLRLRLQRKEKREAEEAAERAFKNRPQSPMIQALLADTIGEI